MTNKIKKKIGFGQIHKLIKSIYKLNFKNILLILFVCVVCFTIVQFAIAGFLNSMYLFAEAISGKKYIASNNILDYLKQPLIILIMLIYIIVLCNLIMFQIGMFVYLFEESRNKRKASIKKMFDYGFITIKKLIYPKNWFIYLIVLFVLPLADVFSISYFDISIVIPGFISDVIRSKLYFEIPYDIFIALLSILAIGSIFSFHYFIVEDISFFQSCKKSIKLFKKKIPTNLITTILFYIYTSIFFLLVSLIIVLFTQLIRGKIFGVEATINYSFDLALSIMLLISLPIVFSISTVLFHNSLDEDITITESTIKVSTKRRIIRSSILAAFILAFASVDISLNVKNYVVYNIESKEPIVVAHRGASLEAPENSIPAFELAIEQGADAIELDIHETKDGVLIVSHDSSLRRIAGINKKVYDLTYEEISKLDVGSWYSKEYSYLRIATLEEVLKLTKNKIDLIIEIKPTAYDDHLEEKLIELIYKYDMKDQILIHSLNEAPLIRINELDSSINIAYCMFLAIGDIDTIEWSDLYTVEESNVDPELVRKVHEAGKKIYVWTINSTDNIQYLIDCGVDGLIGDDIQLLQEYIGYSVFDKGFSKFLRMLANQDLVM